MSRFQAPHLPPQTLPSFTPLTISTVRPLAFVHLP